MYGRNYDSQLNLGENLSNFEVITMPANSFLNSFPGSKIHGANMGSIWGQQDPGGPHVGHMNFVIWVSIIMF